MALIFIAMLLCIQVRANYSTYRPHIPWAPPRTRSRPRPLRRIRVKVKSRTNTVVYREGSLPLLDYLIWSHRRKRQRLKNALPGFKVKWWRQKITFRDGGGLSITPRWHIKHKHAIYRVAIGLLLMVITWQLFGTPIGVVGAVIDSQATGDWNAGGTWVGGIPPATGDDARLLGSHIVTLRQAEICGSCEIQSDGTLDLNTWNLTCDSTNGAGFAFDNDGTLQANAGMITFEDDGANAKVDFLGTLGNPNDITVDYHDWDVIQDTASIIEGNLLVLTGDWSTGAANHACTVTGGAIINGGGFFGNASVVVHGWIDINAGSYTATSINTTIASEDAGSGYAFDNDGVFNHTNGTLIFTYAATTLVDFAGGGPGSPYNLICNDVNLVLTLDSNTTIDHNLTITAGELTTSGTNYALTVTGDVSVVGTFTGNASAVVHGSLTFTGTYSATSGTTTITSEAGSGFALNHDGTLTHNNGIVVITTNENTTIDISGTGNLYNLTINASGRLINWAGSPTIDNDVTVTAGTFRPSNGGLDAITITGDVDVTGTMGGNSQSTANTFGSLTINSGGAYDATSGVTTITSVSGAGWGLYDPGNGFTHNNGTVTFTGTDAQHTRAGGTITYFNLIVNKASNELFIRNTMIVANDLTITSGELDTRSGENNALTVTGTIDVTGTLTCNASTITVDGLTTVFSGGTLNCMTATCTFGATAYTGNWGLECQSGGTFTGGSGTHAYSSVHWKGGTITMSSGTTTITSARSGSNFAVAFTSASAIDDGNGTMVFNRAGNQWLHSSGNVARTFYNITINDASCVVKYANTVGYHMTIDNDLTVTAGEFLTIEDTSGTSRDLTVTGDVDVTGTLTGNASAISMGSITIQVGGEYDATTGTTTITSEAVSGRCIDNDGTFTHNNGTVDISGAINTGIAMGGDDLYNLIIGVSLNNAVLSENLVVANDLTVNGDLVSFATRTLTVGGDCIVNDIIEITSAAVSFGSLTITATGTYSATTGVTTITSETAGGYAINHDGTWIHNNGTVTITYAGAALVDLIGTGNLYNLIINHGSADISWEGNTAIDNDLTVTLGQFKANTVTDTITVTGDVDVTGTLGNNSESATWTFASLTVNSGGTAVLTTGTTELTSETAGGYSLFVVAGGILTTSPGTIDFQITSGGTNIQTTTEALFNVLVSGTQTVTITDATTIGGTLTIEAGAGWDSNATDQDLTVTGTTSITGTLTLNSSTVALQVTTINGGGTLIAPDSSGGLSIGASFNTDGTFTHSDGTVTFNPTGACLVQGSGVGALTFYNLVVNGNSSDRIVGIRQDITVENSITVTTGKFRPNPTLGTVTITVGTNASVGSIVNNDVVDFAVNTTNAATIAAASDAYPIMFTGTDMDWDGGGALSLVTLQDCTYIPAATIGTSTVTVTATRVDFRQPLTVTTATLEGSNCIIDASTMTVTSGVYIEGWLDPTESTRSGWDWILVAGDYTLSTNKTYTSRRNFYKPGGATLILDTGTTLTATDPTVDGTFITAEADLLDTNNGTFTVKYTMDFKIVDAIGDPIQSVVITLIDQFDVQLWTQTTDSNGDITAQAAITAIYGVGARQNHPQNLTMVLTGYQTLNYNFVLNRPMDLTLGLPAAAIPATGGDSAYTDTLTIYRKIGRDDAAQKTYDGGTSVTGSVQQKRVEIKGDTGKVINSVTVIYVPAATVVDVEDKIVLEDTTTVQVTAVKIVNAYDGSIEHKVIST